MTLVQLLLPVPRDLTRRADQFAQTRAELVARFGGVTAYLQTSAHGVWTSPAGQEEHDEVVMVEVVTADFDRAWWRDYAGRLADRFAQAVIHVRALAVETLDNDVQMSHSPRPIGGDDEDRADYSGGYSNAGQTTPSGAREW